MINLPPYNSVSIATCERKSYLFWLSVHCFGNKTKLGENYHRIVLVNTLIYLLFRYQFGVQHLDLCGFLFRISYSKIISVNGSVFFAYATWDAFPGTYVCTCNNNNYDCVVCATLMWHFPCHTPSTVGNFQWMHIVFRYSCTHHGCKLFYHAKIEHCLLVWFVRKFPVCCCTLCKIFYY